MANDKIPETNLTAAEKVLVNLADGIGPPMNEKEAELAKQIKEIRDKGRIV